MLITGIGRESCSPIGRSGKWQYQTSQNPPEKGGKVLYAEVGWSYELMQTKVPYSINSLITLINLYSSRLPLIFCVVNQEMTTNSSYKLQHI